MPEPKEPQPKRGGSRSRRHGRRGPGSQRRGQSQHPAPAQRGEAEDAPETGELVLVQFKGHRKTYYNNSRGIELRQGDYCLVEADRGRDLGRVCYVGPGKPRWWRDARRQGVLEKATVPHLQKLHENRADEWQDYDICLEKIQHRNLKMQLVSVERQFDRNKITFFFTADKRVDFRMLVKDLAAIFRTRIELRQIGVRDEAKMKGGLGLCGRHLCCSSFMHDFSPVTLKMAKTQQLPLSPNKLSGLCGRLRCCLTYEHEAYLEKLNRMPKVGATVIHADGKARVRKIDLLRETATVIDADSEELMTIPVTDLQWDKRQDVPRPRPRGKGGCRNSKH